MAGTEHTISSKAHRRCHQHRHSATPWRFFSLHGPQEWAYFVGFFPTVWEELPKIKHCAIKYTYIYTWNKYNVTNHKRNPHNMTSQFLTGQLQPTAHSPNIASAICLHCTSAHKLNIWTAK